MGAESDVDNFIAQMEELFHQHDGDEVMYNDNDV